ncbi:hypothetical protein WBK31_38710 [Nonomuraea sp. N2-4H]
MAVALQDLHAGRPAPESRKASLPSSSGGTRDTAGATAAPAAHSAW